VTRAERLTRLGIALGCPPPPRKLDPPKVYFRADQTKLDAERDEWTPIIEAAIERYQGRFSRAQRARSRRRKARRSTACLQAANSRETTHEMHKPPPDD
jgi:hypothetical protein